MLRFAMGSLCALVLASAPAVAQVPQVDINHNLGKQQQWAFDSINVACTYNWSSIPWNGIEHTYSMTLYKFTGSSWQEVQSSARYTSNQNGNDTINMTATGQGPGTSTVFKVSANFSYWVPGENGFGHFFTHEMTDFIFTLWSPPVQ